MFSYYGSKSKIVGLYPEPANDVLIEPFAGSARYALTYWNRDVRLYDLSDYVVEVWRYLKHASPADILGLPDVESKVSLNGPEFRSLTDPERWLIGFHLCRGKAKPRHTGHGQNSWSSDKKRIAGDLYKIRHWQIVKGSYQDAPDIAATWFVDPPYEAVQIRPGNSDRYPEWFVDYDDLAAFCRTRKGQVIVCEGGGASWLPFRELATVSANTNARTTKRNVEMVWTNEPR
jgi:site-specific DNA-adenine methylase